MKKQYHTSPRAVKLGAVVAALLLSPASFAQEKERGFYVSPEIGRATIKDYCKDRTGSCSDSGIAYGADAGYQFNQYVSAEAGFRLSSGYDFVDQDGKNESDYRGFLLGLRGTMPIGSFFVEGNAGFNFWKIETKWTGGSVDSDDTDLYFGVGGGYSFSDNLSASINYTRVKLSGQDGEDDDDIDFISASVVYRF